MERLIARLERRFGQFAIHGLTYYLAAGQVLVFLVAMARPEIVEYLILDHTRVMEGQVWRLVTFLFVPTTSSPLWFFFSVYWLYLIGTTLEREWGAFKYQAYWVIGAVLTAAGAFLLRIPATNLYLAMSLFLAFATLFPNFTILVMFILPVHVKWLALLDALTLGYMMVSLPGIMKLLPVFAVGNYLLFFTPTLIDLVRQRGVRAVRSAGWTAKVAMAERGRPVLAKRRCAICGVTNDDPEIEFRVCTCEKCGGKATDFCITHARNH